jgi:methylmalonyl-CoA mutase
LIHLAKKVLRFTIWTLGQLAKDGNWFTTKENNFDTLNLLTTAIPESSISIDGGLYQNAGANMVQQIACSGARK